MPRPSRIAYGSQSSRGYGPAEPVNQSKTHSFIGILRPHPVAFGGIWGFAVFVHYDISGVVLFIPTDGIELEPIAFHAAIFHRLAGNHVGRNCREVLRT